MEGLLVFSRCISLCHTPGITGVDFIIVYAYRMLPSQSNQSTLIFIAPVCRKHIGVAWRTCMYLKSRIGNTCTCV